MNAGLPGTGIGGVFYLACALWMPVDGAIRTLRGRGGSLSWRRIGVQSGIAAGILAALWAMGWLLGYVVAVAAPASTGAGPGGGLLDPAVPVANVIRWAAVLGSAGVLAAVIGSVHLLRLVAARPSPGVPAIPAPTGVQVADAEAELPAPLVEVA